MLDLLLLRHAKSSHDDPRLDDFDRPLNRRGRGDAPRIGAHLAAGDLVPDAVLCSSARRTRETLDGILAETGWAPEVAYDDDLYLAPPRAIVAALRRVPDDRARVLVVGHNPGLELLLEGIIGEHERLPTAAIAHVTVDADAWSRLPDRPRGRLRSLWRPKDDSAGRG